MVLYSVDFFSFIIYNRYSLILSNGVSAGGIFLDYKKVTHKK